MTGTLQKRAAELVRAEDAIGEAVIVLQADSEPTPPGRPARARRTGWWAGWSLVRAPAAQPGEEPDYRFTLANERTFLSWIRTSLALLAAGVAVVQLVPNFRVPGGRHALGIVLALLSLLISATSYRRWVANQLAMRRHQPLPSSLVPRLVGAGLGTVSVLAVLLLLLGPE